MPWDLSPVREQDPVSMTALLPLAPTIGPAACLFFPRGARRASHAPDPAKPAALPSCILRASRSTPRRRAQAICLHRLEGACQTSATKASSPRLSDTSHSPPAAAHARGSYELCTLTRRKNVFVSDCMPADDASPAFNECSPSKVQHAVRGTPNSFKSSEMWSVREIRSFQPVCLPGLPADLPRIVSMASHYQPLHHAHLRELIDPST
ncbi:hypothetical protein NM688_g6289 [Phlebia brevispora]|uniref:Uncharacterized protein n=1 Tax=Phlebia brevispora TaxID=194682 RepID=A0ACC1SHS8_9APHY|nr:hypothetical protein NM688_g6289 [Phlebia brevispora]